MKSNPIDFNAMSGSRIGTNRASTALGTNETVRNRLRAQANEQMRYVERNKMEAHQHMFSKAGNNSTFDILATKVTAARTSYGSIAKHKP